MQSSKMKAKDGSTIDLVDNRISDADILHWNANAGQNFFAIYQSTTFDEIYAAYQAGKAVFMIKENTIVLPLQYITSTVARFYLAAGSSVELYYVDSTKWYHESLNLQTLLTFDTTPTAGSTNPVTSGGIKTAIDSAAGSATANKFTGYNTSNIVPGRWYIIALKKGGANEYERLYEFLICSNDNYAEQMRVLLSTRISSACKISDSKVFISGHINQKPSLLANWKFATLQDTAGTTYTALCFKGTNSASSRSVYWNVRSVRGNNDWNPVSINLDTTTEYTIVSELPFNGANSLPNCITTDSISLNISGNEFNASLPITSGAMFDYLTRNTCNPSKAITLSCGGPNITSTGGSWTSSWKQTDCQLDGNGMLDVTADFGINIINQYTYVSLLTSGTCNLCDWDGNVVASANFSMPKHINNTLVYTVTDNISLRFVVPACESKFAKGLKFVIKLPSNYTINDQVSISNFTLRGTYWKNGTGYNSNAINYDS